MSAKSTKTTPDPTALVTVNGFTVTANTSVSDDYEFIEAIAQAESNSATGLVNMMNRIFPETELARIKEHLRNEHGVVPITAMSEFVKTALKELSPNS